MCHHRHQGQWVWALCGLDEDAGRRTAVRHSLPGFTRVLYGLVLVVAVAAARPAAGQECRAEETGKFFASDGQEGDNFGVSVDLDGDVAIVGALTSETGLASGSAYIYRFDGKRQQWREEAKLVPPGLVERDRFGVSVSLHRGVALVGTQPSTRLGTVYVYRYDGHGWLLEAELTAPDGEFGDRFGQSVSLYGDVAVVGAELDNNENGPNAGSAYVFRRGENGWPFEQKLLASDGGRNDTMGRSVSVYDGRIIVGSHGYDVSRGIAYLYRYEQGAWVEEAQVHAADGESHWAFGWSVALGDSIAGVGQPNSPIESVYVFRRGPDGWAQEAKLGPAQATDTYADQLTIHSDLLLVGVPGDDERARRAGSAFLYRFNGLRWVEAQRLFASDGMEFDNLGFSVAVSGSVALVTARGADINGTSQGATYSYGLTRCRECSGDESIRRMGCRSHEARNTLVLKLAKGIPQDTVAVSTSSGGDSSDILSETGKARIKIKRLPPGSQTAFAEWGCGATARANYTCP